MQLRSDSLSSASKDSAVSNTRSYEAASKHTGQSLPNMIRRDPKYSSAVFTYGFRSSARQLIQFVSVTRPESLHQTFGNEATSFNSYAHSSIFPSAIWGLAM